MAWGFALLADVGPNSVRDSQAAEIGTGTIAVSRTHRVPPWMRNTFVCTFEAALGRPLGIPRPDKECFCTSLDQNALAMAEEMPENLQKPPNPQKIPDSCSTV